MHLRHIKNYIYCLEIIYKNKERIQKFKETGDASIKTY